jgi:hypothetical protein
MNRKEFGRRSVNQRGWVRVPGRPRVPCVARNISPKGALLEMDVPPWLPLRFELSIDPDPRYFPCELRRVGANSIVVFFCSATEVAEKPHQIGAVEEWMGPKRPR